MPKGDVAIAVTSSVAVDTGVVVAPVGRRLFGAFVEHMGRSVYGGIFEPGGRFSDDDGFRTDVLALVAELGVTTVRYPGGNFLSGYDWRDGVGPVDERPRRLDLAWHSLETNEFGTDEFLRWCRRAGVEPMMGVNLGTGTLPEALALLEYCNVDAPSVTAAARVANGTPEPYGVRLWCLGNEMDGPWQLGHKTADEYGRLAAEVARGMRMVDPGVELVACGSSGRTMPTFGAWEETVLGHTYDLVDHLSLHAYYENTGDLQRFLLSATDLDGYIDDVAAIADRARSHAGSDRRIGLALDEYNVWYLSHIQDRPTPATWDIAPRLSEERYTVADAVVLGNLLVTILRHADRLTVACLAQLVNTIATIHAEPDAPAWRQTTFHPFALTARHARGDVLRTAVTGATVRSRDGEPDGVQASAVDAVATLDRPGGAATVFLVNRSAADAADVTVEVPGLDVVDVVELVVLSDPDPLTVNSDDDPERVTPVRSDEWTASGSTVRVTLPAVSWAMLRLRVR